MVGVGLVEPLVQFAVVVAISQAFAASNKAALAARRRYPWATQRPWLLVGLTFVALPVLGGFLNRIRGGWRPLGHTAMGNTAARLLMAGGTASVAYGAGGGSSTLFWFTTATVFLGMLIGWGCYMSMGRPLDQGPLPEGSHTDCIDLDDLITLVSRVRPQQHSHSHSHSHSH